MEEFENVVVQGFVPCRAVMEPIMAELFKSITDELVVAVATEPPIITAATDPLVFTIHGLVPCKVATEPITAALLSNITEELVVAVATDPPIITVATDPPILAIQGLVP